MSKRVRINYTDNTVETQAEIIERLKSWNVKKGTARQGEKELQEFFDNLPKEETDYRMRKARKKYLETSIKNRNLHLHKGQYAII